MEIIDFRQVIDNQKVTNYYDNVFNVFKNSNFYFYNCGFYPYNKNIVEEDLQYSAYISMYMYLLDNINTKNLKILDVSCGLGGSTTTYYKYFNFNEIHGIDINSNFIDFCKQNNKNIYYYNMMAEQLNYSDNSFDIITNVDSSFVYKNKLMFLQECHRVLKEDGVFIYADYFYSNEEELLLKNLYKHVIVFDITENIALASKKLLDDINSMNLSDDQKDILISWANDNYLVYKSNTGYKKYVCFNIDKHIEEKE